MIALPLLPVASPGCQVLSANPLVECYIMEDIGTYNPACSVKHKGLSLATVLRMIHDVPISEQLVFAMPLKSGV